VAILFHARTVSGDASTGLLEVDFWQEDTVTNNKDVLASIVSL